MNQPDTIHRLCALITKVGAEHFDHDKAHDCICGADGSVFARQAQVDSAILDFIENAVNDKLIERHK